MSTVWRLVWTYFTATKVTRGAAALGLACTVVGMAGLVWKPEWAQSASFGLGVQWYEALVLVLPWLGLLFLLASSTMLPAVVERIALGRSIWLLPRGRIRLLASVVLVGVLLGLLTATNAALILSALYSTLAAAFKSSVPEILPSFYRSWLLAFVDFGLVYATIWLVSKTTGVWRLVGMLGALLSLTLPLRYFDALTQRITPLEWIGLASWAVFAALLLGGGRLRHALAGRRARLRSLARGLSPSVQYARGDEAALLLGIIRPWIVALGQLVPIAVMVGVVPEPQVWIVFLMVFSAISGAITSQAAARSRRLWLRYGWTRQQIASRAEAAYWRYNACSLLVLLLVYAGLALYFDFGVEALGLGLALLVVGSVVCTYLGFLITRSLGWFESALCILTMTALTLAGIAIMREQYVVSIEFMLALAVMAVLYRVIGRARWLELDWMQCRFETPARGAA